MVIASPERALECFNKYGGDAVMIGVNYWSSWLFAEIKHYFETGEIKQMRFQSAKRGLKEHILASVKWLDIDGDTPIESLYHQG